MQCVLGYYRDRTDGGCECRYFAAVYPTYRVATYAMYSLTLSASFFTAFIFLTACVVVVIAVVQSYRAPYALYNKLDIVSLLAVSLGHIEASLAVDVMQGSSTLATSIAKVFTIVYLSLS